MTKPRAAKAVLARPATAAPKNASRSTSFFPGIGLILLRVFSTLSGVATAAPLRQLGLVFSFVRLQRERLDIIEAQSMH